MRQRGRNLSESLPIAARGDACSRQHHASNRTFFAPASGFIVPSISAKLTLAEIEEARNLITVDLAGQ